MSLSDRDVARRTAESSTRARKALSVKSAPKPQRTPVPSQPIRADHRGMPDGVSATELHGIRIRLKLAQSCVRVVGAALTDQNCNLDSDAADILATHVTDVLHIQILKIDRLLGHEVHEDDIEESKG